MTRFTKCLPSAAESLQFPFLKTQIGPLIRNISEVYSVMCETFDGMDSSIPVQLLRAAPG
jgi:hypothetical protein